MSILFGLFLLVIYCFVLVLFGNLVEWGLTKLKAPYKIIQCVWAIFILIIIFLALQFLFDSVFIMVNHGHIF